MAPAIEALGERHKWQEAAPSRYASLTWDVAVLLLAHRTLDLCPGAVQPFSGWSATGSCNRPLPLRFIGARTAYDYITGSARRPQGFLAKGGDILLIVDHPEAIVSPTHAERNPKPDPAASSSSGSK